MRANVVKKAKNLRMRTDDRSQRATVTNQAWSENAKWKMTRLMRDRLSFHAT